MVHGRSSMARRVEESLTGLYTAAMAVAGGSEGEEQGKVGRDREGGGSDGNGGGVDEARERLQLRVYESFLRLLSVGRVSERRESRE